jgi:hypothetical protein
MTQQYSQKYTVVCFFEPQDKFSKFAASDWPLHVTILDTFKTAWGLSALSKELGDVVREITPLNTLPTEKALLGETKHISVKLLKLAGPMSALHDKLMTLVDKGDLVFNSPEFVGDGFLPHATDQGDDKVDVGQEYQLNSISLVDMFPDEDYLQRRVVDTYDFKG